MSGSPEESPIISSLNELEGRVVGWTFFAGIPMEEDETGDVQNTIQLPELYRVVRGKLKSIFQSESWIGDREDDEWVRAQEMLLRLSIREIWSPATIRPGSFLLGPGVSPESEEEGEIYRQEGLDDAELGSNPAAMFREIIVHRFIERLQ